MAPEKSNDKCRPENNIDETQIITLPKDSLSEYNRDYLSKGIDSLIGVVQKYNSLDLNQEQKETLEGDISGSWHWANEFLKKEIPLGNVINEFNSKKGDLSAYSELVFYQILSRGFIEYKGAKRR